MMQSNRTLLLCIVIFSIISCKKDFQLSQQEALSNENKIDATEKAETKPAVQKRVSVNINSNIGGYLEALPFEYDKNRPRPYPLIIFIHGTGELGNGTTDLYKVEQVAIPKLLANKTFPPNFVSEGHNFSFIVLSPQFKAWPQTLEVNDMINYAIANYNVNTERIYTCGISMGGGAVWEHAAAYGQSLAAIVPIAGASWPEPSRAQAIAQAKIGVWAFHNNDDNVCPPWYSINYVNNINSYDPEIPAKLTLWPTGGHDAWTKATDPNYKENGKNMYEWMLKYKKRQ